MALTPEQLQARKTRIGSSEAAAVCNADPYRSPWDIWALKTQRDPGFEGNEATERGNRLEPVILDWAQDYLGRQLHRNVMVTHGDVICANLDACDPGEFIVEAKSVTDPDEYGDPETDMIPERFIVQTHVGMLCAKVKRAYVPVLIPGYRKFDFRMYIVDRLDGLAEAIADKVETFWHEHVLANVPPTDCVPSIEVLKRLRRTPAKTVPIADELVDTWISAKAAKKQAEDNCDAAQAALLLALGDGDSANTSRGLLTYTEITRRSYVVEACVYRQLRLKKGKQ